MSREAVAWAMNEAPVTTPAEFAVLVCMADRARKDGTGAWESQATLARKSRCGARTVRLVLRNMEEAGVIRRGDQSETDHLPANRRTVVWDLNLDARGATIAAQDASRAATIAGRQPLPGGKNRPSRGATIAAKTRTKPRTKELPPEAPQTATASKPVHPVDASPTTEPRRHRKTPIPIDDDGRWAPSETARTWTLRQLSTFGIVGDRASLFANQELIKFINHAQSKDARYVNWDAAWRNWVTKALQYAGYDAGHIPGDILAGAIR